MHWGDDVLLLYLAPYFKPHFPKCGDPMLGVKANRSALEYSSSKADELKVEFSAEWLRIWRYERGISLSFIAFLLEYIMGLGSATPQLCSPILVFLTWIPRFLSNWCLAKTRQEGWFGFHTSFLLGFFSQTSCQDSKIHCNCHMFVNI